MIPNSLVEVNPQTQIRPKNRLQFLTKPEVVLQLTNDPHLNSQTQPQRNMPLINKCYERVRQVDLHSTINRQHVHERNRVLSGKKGISLSNSHRQKDIQNFHSKSYRTPNKIQQKTRTYIKLSIQNKYKRPEKQKAIHHIFDQAAKRINDPEDQQKQSSVCWQEQIMNRTQQLPLKNIPKQPLFQHRDIKLIVSPKKVG